MIVQARANSSPGVQPASVVVFAVALSITAHGIALFSVRDALREPEPAKPAETLFELVDVPPPPPAPAEDRRDAPAPAATGPPLAEPAAEEAAGPPDKSAVERAPSGQRRTRPERPKTAEPSTAESPPEPAVDPGPSVPERVNLTGLELPREGSGWAVPHGTTPPRSGTVDPTAAVRKTDKRKPKDKTKDDRTSAAGTGTGADAGGSGVDAGGKRVATHIPTQDVVIVKPKRTKHAEPEYPKTLKAQGIEGNVRVRVAIDTTGRVTKAEVVEGSGHADFDEAARKAALADRYTPATRDGKPVATSISFTYYFRIEED